ncbi:MAG: protein CapL, partial [Bacteroidota bacterium]
MFSAPSNPVIAVVGLGYVGLPLALALSREFRVLGFDINTARVAELNRGEDHTLEADPAELAEALKRGLSFSAETSALGEANVFIVTVPTPIDQFKAPDLKPLLSASATIGAALKAGDVVIYESTTYPGCTEEDCVPVLER